MINRNITQAIKKSLEFSPVVGILGPRQCGKTTLAKMIISSSPDAVYLDLELPSDANKFSQAELFLSGIMDKFVVIDEVQRIPSLFPLFRSLIDRNRRPGNVLLLGSSSPDLVRQSSESLAGRIIYHELTPLNAMELSEGGYDILRHWLRGGFPLSWLSSTDENVFLWLKSFIATYLERDIPQLGLRLPASQTRNLWTMLAHLQAQQRNEAKLASSLGVSAITVKKYISLLEDLFLVRQLPPYFSNVKKRLVKSPKIYVRDSGVLHSLLGVRNLNALYSNPIAGASWEGFIIEQIIGALSGRFEFAYYRTAGGAEADMIIHSAGAILACVEIKLSLNPKVSKGFMSALSDLNCDAGFCIYAGLDRYPLNEKVMAISLLEFIKWLGERDS